MPDWDADSPQLRKNLVGVLRGIRDAVRNRSAPRLEDARTWQKLTMRGLEVPNPAFVGTFRGEPGAEVDVYVPTIERGRVVRLPGVPYDEVAKALAEFERVVRDGIAELDAQVPAGATLTEADLDDIIELAAYAHAEWVRIHPFVNGNGRTARCWANCILMRYGVDRLLQLRQRPDGGYGDAGAAAMRGDYGPTEDYLRLLILGP